MSSYHEHRVHNWGEKPAKENCSYSKNEVTSDKTMNNLRQEGWSEGCHQLRPQLSYSGQSWVLTNQGAAEEKDHSCSMTMGCGCNQFLINSWLAEILGNLGHLIFLMIHLFLYSIPGLPHSTYQWDFLPCVFLILSTHWRILNEKTWLPDFLIALEVW